MNKQGYTVPHIDVLGRVSEKTFYPYHDQNGQTVTALVDPYDGRVSITHKQYQAVVAAYNALPDSQKGAYKKLALMSRQEREAKLKTQALLDPAYRQALEKAGLKDNELSMAIVSDHLTGGVAAQTPVYNVNGYKVDARRMTPEIVSFYVAGNRSNADGLTKALGEKDPQEAFRTVLGRSKLPEEINASVALWKKGKEQEKLLTAEPKAPSRANIKAEAAQLPPTDAQKLSAGLDRILQNIKPLRFGQ